LNMFSSASEPQAGQNPAEINWFVVLPDTISGWQKTEDKIFNRETLYRHINGGAELYLSYGFRSLFSRTYNCPGQPELIIEVFDMETSANAYGVFAHSRESTDILSDSTFGQGSQYIDGLLLFWKDRYLLSLLGSPETELSGQVIYKLAEKIEQAIPRPGKMPALLSLLPPEGLIQSSIRYFHHHIWLNTYYYIADQNILHIDQNCEAMLAEYRQGESSPLLLLVIKYPDPQKALSATQNFKKTFLADAGERSVLQIEDKYWTGYKLDRSVLVIVFRSDSKHRVEEICKLVESNLIGFSESQ
jgi:hypothetical protein